MSIIRSTLMSSSANHVSLLFAGSIRDPLQLMLERSDQPIFGEAAEMQLRPIGKAKFYEDLDFHFKATGKLADEDALNYLLNATRAHSRNPATRMAVLGRHAARKAGAARGGADPSTSATASGTSPIRSSANGCGGRRR